MRILAAFAVYLSHLPVPDGASESVATFLASGYMGVTLFFGEASYAFYLVHQPLLGILGAGQWEAAITVTSIAYELATLGLVLAVAVGLHVTVETPARIWIRKLARRPPP